MKVFLVLLFLVGEEWYILDPYLPTVHSSMEDCIVRELYTENYMAQQDLQDSTDVACLEAKEGELGTTIKNYIKGIEK